MTDYLFDHLYLISEKINKADEIFLFLDYDGTLVSFKNRPQDVVTSNEVKTVVSSLLQKHNFKVVIVTGRTLSEIKELLDLDRLSYAALHGLQIQLSNGKNYNWKSSNDFQKILINIKNHSEKEFQNEKGIYLEDKEFTLAFHYRMLAKEKIKDVVDRFIEIVKNEDIFNKIDILHGSKVIEVRPAGWDKGKAVELISSSENSKNTLAIYIGDDNTDEDAFQYLNNKGLTIFVSNNTNRSSSAQYWLKNPDEVLNFLKSLQKI
jgi:trehalose 6-phosphate phosphatase